MSFKSIAQYLDYKKKVQVNIIIVNGQPYVEVEEGESVYIDTDTGTIIAF